MLGGRVGGGAGSGGRGGGRSVGAPREVNCFESVTGNGTNFLHLLFVIEGQLIFSEEVGSGAFGLVDPSLLVLFSVGVWFSPRELTDHRLVPLSLSALASRCSLWPFGLLIVV